MNRRIFLIIFALGITGAIALFALSYVDIVSAKAVYPAIDESGYITEMHWYSIYELLVGGGVGPTVIFVLANAVYGLTAAGCAVGLYFCVSPRGEKLDIKKFAAVKLSLVISIALSVMLFLVSRVAAFALTPCF